MIAKQIQSTIGMIARANGVSIESVFDGGEENDPEIELSNKISIVFASASPKPWEVYHETSPGEFTTVNTFDSVDKLTYGLSQKLMDMAAENKSTLTFDAQKSFTNTDSLSPN
ncbi:hypothetical protein N9L66_05205 [Porticoccaceae bacterium]|nr:hypothetical protein [Porticoccaceae bacterium]MDA8664340.1 hypothetical protein [Porticoccaceae bacterium]MDA8682265.1 hypothetical protein [Porticoccaceae bacterium]MDA8788881.1 hypothetical protein [Porticoccaceae bacterium]MDB2343792.1 hypothetical protein [Porticoccaceae bacterium]